MSNSRDKNMTKALVSIIIPCYNYEKFIPYTLDNVLNQSYTNWECIIVNDGSKDNTEEVVKPYLKDPRFRYIYQKNGGLSNARNTGLRNSKGDYIQFLDSDDLMEENKIISQVEFLESNPSVDIIYGDVKYFQNGEDHKKNSSKIQLKVSPQEGRGNTFINEFLIDNFFLVHCPLLRKTVIEDIGYFNESMPTHEDWDYWFRCAFVGKNFHYSPSVNEIAYVRGHGTNMSGNKKNMWAGKIMFYENALLMYQNISSNLYSKNELRSIKIKTLSLRYLLKMRFELYFGNTITGIANMLKHIYYSKTIISPTYDALYWLKERIKKK